MDRSPHLRLAAMTLAASLGLSSAVLPGCRSGCGRQDDGADPARASLDVASVHVYLAAKAAVVAKEPSEDAARVRALVGKAVSRSETLTAAEALDLDTARALWRLREDGKRVLEGNPGRDLPPLLPALAGMAGSPASAPAGGALEASLKTSLGEIDAETEHALLLVTMFALARQPVAPAPIPSRWVLYEAWMTRPERAELGALVGSLHGMRAAVFGASGLCDLAAESGRAAARPVQAASPTPGLGLDLAAEEAGLLASATRAMGHAASAECFARRADRAAARREADGLVEAAGAMGVAGAELDALRAAAGRLAEGSGSEAANALVASATGLFTSRFEATGLARVLGEAGPLAAAGRFTSALGRLSDELRDKVPGVGELGPGP